MNAANKRVWLITLFCGGVLVTLSLGLRQGFGLFLRPMTLDLNLGREVFALAIATQNMVWGLTSPVFGGMADKYGARKVIAGGALLYAAGLAFMGIATSGTDIMVGQVLIGMGLGSAGVSVVLGVVGRAAPPEKRSMALGIVTAGGSFGQFFLVAVSQNLIDALGWSMTLMTLAGIAAIGMTAFSVGLRSPEGAGEDPGVEQSLGGALGQALTHRSFLLLTAGFFVCGFQVVFIATHLPAFLQDKGFIPEIASWSLALVGLFNIFGSLAAGWIGGKAKKSLSLGWFYLIRSAIIAAFILAPVSPLSALFFGAAVGVFWLGTIPLTSGLIVTFFGARYLGMLYGVVFISHQVGSFLGAWYGGYLYDTTGSYETMWWLTVIAGGVAAALHWMIREEHPRIATQGA